MNTYSVTTGVLVFDGAPNITEGLKAWLHPVQHRGPQDIPPDDTYLGVPGVGIFQEDEDSVYIDDLQGAIETALRARGVEPDDQADMGELVEQLIEVSGVGEAAAWIKDKIQQEETFEASDLVRCAMLFGDGHNARAAVLQTGIFSDKTRLWSFGGYAETVQRQADGSVGYACVAPRQLAFAAARGTQPLAESMGGLAQALVPLGERAAFLEAFCAKLTEHDQDASQQEASRSAPRPTN